MGIVGCDHDADGSTDVFVCSDVFGNFFFPGRHGFWGGVILSWFPNSLVPKLQLGNLCSLTARCWPSEFPSWSLGTRGRGAVVIPPQNP